MTTINATKQLNELQEFIQKREGEQAVLLDVNKVLKKYKLIISTLVEKRLHLKTGKTTKRMTERTKKNIR